jgi:hypothetical protein
VEFGRVPSTSFIFTGSKMARICKVQSSLTDRGPLCLREVLGSLPTGISGLQQCFTLQGAFYQAKPVILEKTLNQNY